MKVQGGAVQLRIGGVVVSLLLALACSESSSNPRAPGVGESGAGGEVAAPNDNAAGSPVAEPATVENSFGSDFFSPQGLLGGEGEGGAAGEGSVVLGPPYGTSTECGDAIVGPSEECDDGAGGAGDACTSDCFTRDQAAGPIAGDGLPSNDRYLGAGRHPVAGLEGGFITTYVEVGAEEPVIGATLFNIWGQPQRFVAVSEGASPIYEANPVAAALPDGSYAVAWADFDGDGSDLGVALRRVAADGTLGPLAIANSATEFSQLNPDLLWTGSELVVAWEDYADPFDGPDLRVRTFDAELNPTSGELALAESSLPEAAVALAAFDGGWAAAYREGAVDGKEAIVVKAANKTFRIGPAIGGPLDDRPALVALDATHLLVAFSVQTDPSAGGFHDVSRICFAVVDVNGSLTPPAQSLDPVDDVYTRDAFVSQLSPSAASAGTDGVYLAWRSEARPGDASGDQVWLKTFRWAPASPVQLEARDAELLLPRTCEGSIGDQRRPALAQVSLPPNGALAVAWDDYSHAQGTGEPDVVVHYAPMHPQDLQSGSVFTETWTAPNGPAWSSHWSTAASSGVITASTNADGGRVLSTAANATLTAWVNHHSALNLDVTAKMLPSSTGVKAGFIARRTDDDDDSYLAVRFSMVAGDPWRIFGMLDNVQIDIATAAPPSYWIVYSPIVEQLIRFRVTDNADGTIAVAAKVWVVGVPEPSTWSVQGTVPIAGTGSLPNLGRRLSGRAGQFGLYANLVLAGRSVTFDDFKASFFEGTYAGEPTSNLEPWLPLKRGQATYRTCTSADTCGLAEGCCNSDLECAAGLSCSADEAFSFGLGSHAKTCSASHCTNGRRDADELRADCGGADCAPCSCTSTTLPGAGSYCSPSCPCGVGDGECAVHADCLPGLLCGASRGYMFGLPDGSEACVANHCFDFVQNGDETEGIDCSGSCGSCACSGSPNGGYMHCTVFCPCPRGEGQCTHKAHCAGDLVCASGFQFGLGFRTCVAAHCTNNIMDTALGETGKDCGGPDCGTVCAP